MDKIRQLTKKTINYIKNNPKQVILLLVVILFAFLIRILLIPYENPDYTYFLSPWYDYIKSHGFAAYKDNFANYNMPYLYLLGAGTLLPLSKIAAIKLISIFFDFILAFIVTLIVREKSKNKFILISVFSTVLIAPSILLNSSLWGQCDNIFTAFIMASVFLLIRKKVSFAMIAYGLALAFKLQAVFVAPVLLILLLKKDIKIKHLLLIPITYLITLIPALIAGRGIIDLLSIYVTQSTSDNRLSLNAANMYHWFSFDGAFQIFSKVGLIFAVIVALILIYLVYKSRKVINKELLIKIFLMFAVTMPFVLPKMHERYFYIADVLSIIYAFYFPKKFYVPIIIISVSVLSYTEFLLMRTVVDYNLLAVGMLGVVAYVIYDVMKDLFSSKTVQDKKDHI